MVSVKVSPEVLHQPGLGGLYCLSQKQLEICHLEDGPQIRCCPTLYPF